MQHEPDEVESPRTLWEHVCVVWRRVAGRRPFSFYLLFALLVLIFVMPLVRRLISARRSAE